MQANLRSLRGEFIHPRARMLPLFRYQSQVYRIGEKVPPPGLVGYQPRWEVVNAILGARQTAQVRVDLMTGFYMLGMLGQASLNTIGGFRVQIRDVRRKKRLSGRGLQFQLSGGSAGFPYFSPEPYEFQGPRPQALLILQNLEAAQNTIQFVMYGGAEPFYEGGSDGQ